MIDTRLSVVAPSSNVASLVARVPSRYTRGSGGVNKISAAPLLVNSTPGESSNSSSFSVSEVYFRSVVVSEHFVPLLIVSL